MGNEVSGTGTEESNWAQLNKIQYYPISVQDQRRERLMSQSSDRCNERTAVEGQP
jgi:hypothetical protein